MRWWERVLSLCAAVLLMAGCDLRPVTDQVSVIDTFAGPAALQQPAQASEDAIPHVTAEPIEITEPTGTEPPAAGANPNEHRSQADVSVPDDTSPSEAGDVDDAADEPARITEAGDGEDSATAEAGDGDDPATAEAGDGDDPATTEAGDGDGPTTTGDASAPSASNDDSPPVGARPSSAPTARVPAPARSTDSATVPVPLSAIERQIVGLLNAEREAAGLQPLSVDSHLTHDARAWATTMARSGTFEHESERGFSENIAFGYADAAEVHRAWMASPGHRANRLRPRLTSYGVGVHAAGTTLYFAERFR
jgi:uncharacterized protein YkwD